MSAPGNPPTSAIGGRATSADGVTVYVDTREGPAPAVIPGQIVESLVGAAAGETRLEHGLVVAALVIVRLGREAGEALLRHWLNHDPGVVLDADPRFVHALAWEPEPLTGSLAGRVEGSASGSPCGR
jgi:hypothetical protein